MVREWQRGMSEGGRLIDLEVGLHKAIYIHTIANTCE